MKAFQQKARELGLVTVINLYEREGQHTYDSSPVIDADGTLLGVTRMIHITDYPCFHEQGYYTPGDKGAPVFKTKVGTVGVAICYDRHFPEYMRALAVGGADLVIVPQAGAVDEWPEGLYKAEMRVAAFQNGYFTALCNRVGKEDRLDFAGESFVCGPDGEVIARAPKSADAILYADVDLVEHGAVERSAAVHEASPAAAVRGLARALAADWHRFDSAILGHAPRVRRRRQRQIAAAMADEATLLHSRLSARRYLPSSGFTGV